MTINAHQFSTQIVIPTLQMLDQKAGIPYTDIIYYLVMGTIANESLLGTWLVQEGGPALGLGQIEPATLTSLIAKLTAKETAALSTIATPASPTHTVVANLPYAVALVRLFYWHNAPTPLPVQATIAAIYAYYKQYYNTRGGAATLASFTQTRRSIGWRRKRIRTLGPFGLDLQNHILPNKSGEAGPLGQSDSPIYCRVRSDSRLCLVQLIQ